MKKCPQCSAMNADQSLYCSNCGYSLEGVQPSIPSMSPPTPLLQQGDYPPASPPILASAITSCVFGVLTIICGPLALITAPLALLFGVIALRKNRKAPNSANFALAVIGIVLGLIVGLVILLLAAIAAPGFFKAKALSEVSRTKSDLRSMATALEAYWIDSAWYPPNLNTNPPQVSSALTTPVAYVTMVFPDVFAPTPGTSLRYYTDGKGWIMWSAGPDNDYDLQWQIYNLSFDQPSDELLALYTYDPTNGTVSDGDIWRVRD